jgi:hypothetical protein
MRPSPFRRVLFGELAAVELAAALAENPMTIRTPEVLVNERAIRDFREGLATLGTVQHAVHGFLFLRPATLDPADERRPWNQNESPEANVGDALFGDAPVDRCGTATRVRRSFGHLPSTPLRFFVFAHLSLSSVCFRLITAPPLVHGIPLCSRKYLSLYKKVRQ